MIASAPVAGSAGNAVSISVVVLGHNGFVGRNLMAYLSMAFPRATITGRSLPETDLTRPMDVDALADLFTPDTVVIMCSGIKKQHGDTIQTFEQNMAMAINVCRLLQRRPVKRVLFFSTADVYGEEYQNSIINEETPVRPSSYYGAAKYASECILRRTISAATVSGSLVILRMPFIYGPGDHEGIYGPLGFLKAALERASITLWGDGEELREFLYVRDLCRVVADLLLLAGDDLVLVASGVSHTFREVVEIVRSLVPHSIEVTSRPRTKGKVDNLFANHHLRELLPSFTFTGLAEGIRETLEAVRHG